MVVILIFTSWSGILVFTRLSTYSRKNSKNQKKHVYLPFFIRNVNMSGDLAMSGLKQSNRVYSGGWLG